MPLSISSESGVQPGAAPGHDELLVYCNVLSCQENAKNASMKLLYSTVLYSTVLYYIQDIDRSYVVPYGTVLRMFML